MENDQNLETAENNAAPAAEATDQAPQKPAEQTKQPSEDIPDDFQGGLFSNDKGERYIPLQQGLDERKKRQEIQDRLRRAEDELFMYRISQQQQQQPQSPQQHEQPPAMPPQQRQQHHADQFDADGLAKAILSDLPDDEIVNVSDLRKAITAAMQSALPSLRQQQPMPQDNDDQMFRMAELVVYNTKPDARDKINAFGKRVESEPFLRQAVLGVPAMYRPLMAYHLGEGRPMTEAFYLAQAGSQPQPEDPPAKTVERILKTSNGPPPTNKMASQPLAAADRFKSMSSEEFEAEFKRVLEGR